MWIKYKNLILNTSEINEILNLILDKHPEIEILKSDYDTIFLKLNDESSMHTIRDPFKQKIKILKNKYLAFMHKYKDYKRNGSTPHSEEYLKDSKIASKIAKELDKLTQNRTINE